MKSELIKWRIQVREKRDAVWKNHSGLFETRWMAVHQARRLREGTAEGKGLGRGNVRVVKHERKVKAA